MSRKADAVIRFRFRSDAQTNKLARESVNSFAKDFASIIVNRVTIAASTKAYTNIRNSLTSKVRSAVARETAQMAFLVSRFLVQPYNATGPKGTLTPFDPTASAQAREQRWRVNYFNLDDSGVTWQSRSHNYLMWKGKKAGHEDWWKLTGDLHDEVSKTAFYYENFGPISVQFVRDKSAPAARNVTTAGRGRLSATAHVGSIIVSVMSRITPDMLPALASGEPKSGATPRGRHTVASLIQDSDTRKKLTGRRFYRPVLEPFLAYFLTRAIPNAVYNQVEKLVEVSAGSNFLKNPGFAGVEDFSLK